MSKILITTVYPAPYRTGIFELISKVHNVSVIFDRNSGQNRNPNWFSKKFSFKYYFFNKKGDKKKFTKVLKNISTFDIVLIYDYYTKSSILTMFYCIFKRIPFIINCDGAFIQKKDYKFFLKRFFITRASALFASGKYAKEYFLHFGAKENKIYFHNFTSLYESDLGNTIVDSNFKNILKSHLNVDMSNKIILTIGQFTYRKGVDLLLKAAFLLKNKNYTFIVIGGGELKQNFIEFVKNNNLSNVILLDYLTKDELKKYYQAADVFLLPTREDIWGLVVNEAMSFGLPIISTSRCIAAMELINHGVNGYIYEVDDIQSMISYINILMEDPILCHKFGVNNIYYIQNYTIENIVKSHLSVINNLIKEK